MEHLLEEKDKNLEKCLLHSDRVRALCHSRLQQVNSEIIRGQSPSRPEQAQADLITLKTDKEIVERESLSPVTDSAEVIDDHCPYEYSQQTFFYEDQMNPEKEFLCVGALTEDKSVSKWFGTIGRMGSVR